jgi:hypothetical protein
VSYPEVKGCEVVTLSDDQLRAIGRVSVSFNRLEYWLNVCLWVFINPDQPGIAKIGFEGESFDRVVSRVRRLSASILRDEPTWLDRMQRWTDRASDVQRRRNDVLHAMWEAEEPTGEAVGQRLLRRNAPEIASTSTELNRLADDIEDTLKEGITVSGHVFLSLTKPGSFFHDIGTQIREIRPLS